MALTAEQRFKKAVRSLWAKGYYPSPSRLNAFLHGRRSNHLGGKQPQWRREVMQELGIPLQRKPRYRELDFGSTAFGQALASMIATTIAHPDIGKRKIDL